MEKRKKEKKEHVFSLFKRLNACTNTNIMFHNVVGYEVTIYLCVIETYRSGVGVSGAGYGDRVSYC